jgi:hypothetical protein
MKVEVEAEVKRMRGLTEGSLNLNLNLSLHWSLK